MVTRFYFAGIQPAPISPPFGFSSSHPWDDTSLAIRRALLSAKTSGESLHAGPSYHIPVGGVNHQDLSGQFISAPLSAQTISHTGTFQGFVAGVDDLDSLSSIIGTLKIYVVNRAGTAVTGYLWEANANTTPFVGDYTSHPTPLSTHITSHVFQPITDLNINDGDRLVVEIGIEGNGSNGAQNASQQFGAPSALSDFTSAGQNTMVAWIEFSQTLVFEPPTSAAISSAELAASNADRTFFVGNNVLRDYASLPTWHVGAVDFAGAGADITDPDAPGHLAFDGQGNERTSPIDQGGTTAAYTFLGQLNPGTDGYHQVDCLLILGHNFASLEPNMRVQVSIAGLPDFSDGVGIYDSDTGGGVPLTRIWVPSLNTNTRYWNIVFFRVIISTDNSMGLGGVPALGELILGRRRQMTYFEEVPWEDRGIHSDMTDFVAKAGNRWRYARSKGQRIFNIKQRSGGVSESPIVRDELSNLFRECEFGGAPVIICPHPHTINNPLLCYFDPPDLDDPMVAPPVERFVELKLIETPPYLQIEFLPTYPV